MWKIPGTSVSAYAVKSSSNVRETFQSKVIVTSCESKHSPKLGEEYAGIVKRAQESHQCQPQHVTISRVCKLISQKISSSVPVIFLEIHQAYLA